MNLQLQIFSYSTIGELFSTIIRLSKKHETAVMQALDGTLDQKRAIRLKFQADKSNLDYTNLPLLVKLSNEVII